MPRKAHRKSRYGCDNCRQRRVKCDEQGPPCTNCVLRQLGNCVYSRVTPASLLTKAGIQSQKTHEETKENIAKSVSDIKDVIPTSPSSSATAVDQLELMHQFSTETYQSLCISDSETFTWQTIVPRIALRNRYLMHGILALASLHIATKLDSTEAAVYIDTGLVYYNMSLEPFRLAINSLTQENCDAVLAQSVLTTAINLALSQLAATRHSASGMIENTIMAFELLQGVKKILTIGHSWTKLGLFSQGDFWKDVSGQLDEDTSSALNNLSITNENLRDETNAPDYPSNRDVINHLRYCFMKFSCTADPAPVLSWLAAVDTSFVNTLRERSPFSLVILAHWGILLCELDDKRWWARNTGQALILELLESLRTGSPSWMPALSWVERKMPTYGAGGINMT